MAPPDPADEQLAKITPDRESWAAPWMWIAPACVLAVQAVIIATETVTCADDRMQTAPPVEAWHAPR
eukprot:3655728-Prymnesium_polylepis.2